MPYVLSSQEEVTRFDIEIVRSYPHDSTAFTQGLIIHHDTLYESTGLYGHSSLRQVNLETGDVNRLLKLPLNVFGEGIAYFDKRLIQLTWREKKAFVYDADTFELLKTFSYQGDGWGLCSDAECLYMSNGSDIITVRDPHTFDMMHRYVVKDHAKQYDSLNDLQCVGDSIYANRYRRDEIIRFNKRTGAVTGIINVGSLLTKEERRKLSSDSVLNGIAYSAERETFFLTGKNWPRLFEVRFIPIQEL